MHLQRKGHAFSGQGGEEEMRQFPALLAASPQGQCQMGHRLG